MNSRFPRLGIIGATLNIILLAGAGWAQAEKAPDFSLQDLNGKTVTLADLKGKVVILDFWATWCGPCRRGIPDLNAIYRQYKKKGATVVGIALDDSGKADILKGMKKHKLNIAYPVLIGNKEITDKYGGINAIPATFIVDKEGNIASSFVGLQEKKTFTDELDKLLNK